MASPSPLPDPAAPAVELLVSDPHEPTRLGLGLLLRREPWVARCHLAGDEAQALALLRRHRPPAAVVDIARSGPFVGATVAALRSARPGLQVILTSHCPGASVPHPRSLGAAAFIPAGSSVADIAATVRRALREEPVDAPARAEVDVLSRRERDVLALLATGATNREIAAELYLGPDTVKKHASSLYRKLGVRNRTEATQRAATALALQAG